MPWLPPPGRRRALVAPGLLLGLALAQIAGWAAYGLTPWKGGGFGMFATNDHGGFRRVQVIRRTPEGEQVVPVPDALERERRRAREAPSEANLRRLAEAMRAVQPQLGALRVE